MRHIYVLTGEIHSGKTTALSEWAADKPGVYGILSPVMFGKKYVTDLRTGNSRQLQVNDSERGGGVIYIGSYRFDKQAFRWARDRMMESINMSPDWFIVDEIGPLEIRGDGLEPAFREILLRSEILNTTKLIVVVREGLLDTFIEHYRLNREQVIPFTPDLN